MVHVLYLEKLNLEEEIIAAVEGVLEEHKG